MTSLLIIDDDPQTIEIWRDYFGHCGFEVLSGTTTAEGLKLAEKHQPACVLLDVRFDQEREDAGYFACAKLREFYQGPILMLSAYKVSPLDKVQGLEFGATAYLEKTITLRELEGWVRAQIRTYGKRTYRVGEKGDIEVDTERREVRKRGKALPLTQTEFRLLAYLCAHRGFPQSKDALLDLLYADDEEATEGRLTSHIYNLRRHIEDDSKKPAVIVTVHGFGYRVP